MNKFIYRPSFPSVSALPANRSVNVSFDDVLIDRRFLARYAENHFGDGVNYEFAAQVLADSTHRAIITRALAGDVMSAALEKMCQTPLITKDTPTYMKHDVFAEVEAQLKVLVGTTVDTLKPAIVVSEFMVSMLAPLGIVANDDDPLVTISEYRKLFPDYSDLMHDVWVRELTKTLDDARKLDVGTATRMKIGTKLVGARLQRLSKDLLQCINRIGDYAVYAEDALTLVRYNVLPHTAVAVGAGFIPQDLIQHPAVKQMAANLVIARIALDRPVRNVRTTAFLGERLAQVASFFFESKRYVRVSLTDFARHWTKTTVFTPIDKKFATSVLSYNLCGKPSAQAVQETASLFTKGALTLLESTPVTKILDAHYGQVLGRFSTKELHKLLANAYEDMAAQDMLIMDEADHLHPMTVIDPFSEGGEADREMAIQALAFSRVMAAGGEVAVVDNGIDEFESSRAFMQGDAEGDTLAPIDYAFIYKFEREVNYVPQSGIRDVTTFELLDPYETVALSEDFAGTVELNDKSQVYPKTALAPHGRVLGKPNVNSVSVGGFAKFEYTVRGVTLDGGFQFVGPSIPRSERDARTVVPLLNNVSVTTAFEVLNDLATTTDTLEQSGGPRAAVLVYSVRQKLLGYLLLARDAMGNNVIDPYVRDINSRIKSRTVANFNGPQPQNPTDEAVLAQIRALDATMSDPAYRRVVDLFVMEQVLGLLGLLPTTVTATTRVTTGVLDRVLRFKDAEIMMGVRA